MFYLNRNKVLSKDSRIFDLDDKETIYWSITSQKSRKLDANSQIFGDGRELFANFVFYVN